MYTAGKELEYDSDNGYKIVGVQEVNGLEDVKYRIEAKFTKEAVVSVAIDNFGIVNKEEITKLYDFLCDEIWRDH